MLEKSEMMTVKQLCDMYRQGVLHANQSTQRKFLYNAEQTVCEDGKITKAGDAVRTILQHHIDLPGLSICHNTDTGALNLLDGKQRFLSIYHFLYPDTVHTTSTIINGRTVTRDGLSENDIERLLSYRFSVATYAYTSKEEELAFYKINTSGLPLTPYESLAGEFYGRFISTFEKYIEERANSSACIKPIQRGVQAYQFLLQLFDINDSKKALSTDTAIRKLSDRLRTLREISFEPATYKFDALLDAFEELNQISDKIKEPTKLGISNYLVRNDININKVLDCYRECFREINDINSWDINTHKTFIKACVEGKRLHSKRYFSKEDKDILWRNQGNCACCGESNYSKLEVDHIIPWAEGGLTILDNAQLLCKHCNTSKGKKI